MSLKSTVLPLHYGVPQRCGAAIISVGPFQRVEAQTIDGARLRAGVPKSNSTDPMQALENVTAAGISVIEHAYQPGSYTWGNVESE